MHSGDKIKDALLILINIEICCNILHKMRFASSICLWDVGLFKWKISVSVNELQNSQIYIFNISKLNLNN